MNSSTAKSVSALFTGTWDRNYVSGKIKTDPVYPAVLAELTGSTLPLLDLGCGLGVLAFFLRENGFRLPIHGLDYDERKIVGANAARERSGHEGLVFAHHDARTGLPPHQGDVTILDILQFFSAHEQRVLLELALTRVAPGGKLIIRSGLKDNSLRFKITLLGDLIAKATFWMKAAPTHYPAYEDFQKILSPHGELSIQPLWGKTPFNNHLIVLRKHGV